MSFPLFTDDVPEAQRLAIDVLYKLKEWPQDWSKDVAMMQRVSATFPGIDLCEEALHFITWLEGWREKHPRKEIKHRARFVNWAKNSKRFAARRQAQTPASKDEHGATRIEGW